MSSLDISSGDGRLKRTHLEALKDHVEHVPDRILRPEAICVLHAASNPREYPKCDVVEVDQVEERDVVVVLVKRVWTYRRCLQNFDMVPAVLSNRQDADHNVAAVRSASRAA